MMIGINDERCRHLRYLKRILARGETIYFVKGKEESK